MRLTVGAIALATAAIVAAAAPAGAADVYDGGPPVPSHSPGFDWSGPYLGVQAGLDWNRALTPPFAATESGLIAGLYGGVNMQMESLVVGLDASINWDNARGGDPTAPATNSAGPTWKGFVRGRLGFAADNLLFYASGGGVVMGYRANVTGFSPGTATPWGWTVGAGIEMEMSPGWVGRLDYAYQDFGTFTLGGPGPVGGSNVSLTASTLTIGIARKY